MEQFKQLISINHQGVVIVFGRPNSQECTDIYYNVLGLYAESDDENLDWSGFIKLNFPTEVRQVGMSIITLETESSTLNPAGTPFRVITDQKYVSVVQQSAKGTLYINRFKLIKTNSNTDQKTIVYSLSPAWEVRFSRSKKEDVPADKSDTQNYLTQDNKPFLEPSLELSMVDIITDGAFDVVLLPVSGSDLFAWQFFALNKTINQVSLYNFPATKDGLFDVSKKNVTDDYKIMADSAFGIKKNDNNMTITNPPRAVVYTKHEKMIQADGTSIGVKRAARVMVAIPGTCNSETVTATVDSAVGTAGSIANLNDFIQASEISPAEFDLLFDGVSYLTLNPPASGDNPLAIKGAYTMEFMAQPGTLGDGLLIIGGSDTGNPAQLAPYAKMVSGCKLEVGFGNGTEQVSCVTKNQIFKTDTWISIKIDYTGPGENPFIITVNDSVVPVTPASTIADPCGSPVNSVGSPANGFIGSLNSIKITVAGTTVLDLDCNAVDYSTIPPTTKDNSASGVTVPVYGPKLEPSSSPVDSNMSGTFYIDDMGLTYYVGTMNFITPLSSTCLTDGSDGLLHLYYQGTKKDFSVAQFSKISARATFYTQWEAKSGDTTQNGFLNFTAQRVGTYMNTCTVKVTPSGVADSLCNITVTGTSDTGAETWTGLPRSINTLAKIWNGAGKNSPDDRDVIEGKSPYFDYNGKIPSVIIPNSDPESGGYFQFTSVPTLPLKIASVLVEQGLSSGVVNITIVTTPPPTWTGTTITQKWLDVTASPISATEIFSGKSTVYDYSTVQTTGTKSYGIPASTAHSDDQVSMISLYVQDALANFNLKVTNDSSAEYCKVTICGITLSYVPRDQNSFVTILNGQDEKYIYPDGYKNDIASKIYGITNGLTARVLNCNIKKADIAGGLPYAGLLRLLYNGQKYDSGYMSPIPQTNATPIQGATLSFKGKDVQINKSKLFSITPATAPTNGAIGKILDTSSFTGGKAGILEPGVNGGWMQQAPRFCLSFNKAGTTNDVTFNIDKSFSPSDKLSISSDLTLETWLNQDSLVKNKVSRAITYNVTGNSQHPGLPIQFLAGSRQGAGLVIGSNTYVVSSYNFTPPNLTMQIYVKPTSSMFTGIIFSISPIRSGGNFLTLSLNYTGRPILDFLGGAGTITGNKNLIKGQFTCLTAQVADAGSGKVTLSLYYNSDAPQTVTVENTFTGNLGTLYIGTSISQDLVMTVNGAAFWQRALSVVEVQNSYKYGFPDNDEELCIRWNFSEGQGEVIMNSAATGNEFNAKVINPETPPWDESGAFLVPYMGRNGYILQSNRILKDWTHMALASKQGYALNLNGSQSGVIAEANSFNPGASFAIEAWVNPNILTKKQVIVEKPGSYSLYTNTLGQVCLSTVITQSGDYYNSDPIIFNYDIKTAIQAGQTSYIAVNFTCGTVNQETGSTGDPVKSKYYIYTSLYINGKKVITNNKEDYTKPVAVNQKTSSFYVGVGGDATFYWNGLISNIRVWGRTLKETEINNNAAFHLPPTNQEGLVSAWNFDENEGTIAHDLVGKNNIQLTSNQLWTIWQDVSYAHLYVNGRPGIATRLNPADVGDYNDTQFTVGGCINSSILSMPFIGAIDDIRLFSTLLTEEQVREEMNTQLTGKEENLAGYWKIDAGSGVTLFDMTGRGNNGTLNPTGTPPLWEPSTAPISNEGASVINVLGGLESIFIAQLNGEPSVIEYGTTEKDAYGNLFGVMKRGYFYLSSDDETVLETGYKVGDLDTIYIGQVQTAPSVVGYIEGGPPIPSENQTIPYWTQTTMPLSEYDSASSVTYQESETKEWTFNGSQASTFTGSFNLKGGLNLVSSTGQAVGIGVAAVSEILKTQLKIGVKTSLSGTLESTDSVEQSHSNSSNLTNTLTPSGKWEPADNILNPDVGRRFIQNNLGIAIVKSATADLYMLALKGTLTPVAYSLVPNTTIPVDTNIIDFSINPKYIKNGTLDGKVGLKNDPDYPNANTERGSYFKPVEAYALKQKIEREEQQLKAYYDQVDIDKYRIINSLGKLKSKLKENKAYDFEKKLNLRSIFNNYVWSAGGGLHKEEHSVANSYSESYTGASSLTFAAGIEINLDIGTAFGGYYLETDVMLGNTWQMTATKTETAANNFSLLCTVNPTNFLQAPILTQDKSGELQCTGYKPEPEPGKVDGYRYMSFFIAPSDENFRTLQTVIDPNWLNNSTSAAANAMREAVAAENGAWRIMHRTTYVSRVPAPFQPVKDENVSPNFNPPANLDSNYWLVTIISKLLNNQPNPTPLEIGTAINSLIGEDKDKPGILSTLIPWWKEFLTAAHVYGSNQFNELAELREDLLTYMISKYEADQYLNI